MSQQTSEILLSYHSSTIRQTDLMTVQEEAWVGDSIINFCFECITNEVLPEVSKRDIIRIRKQDRKSD